MRTTAAEVGVRTRPHGLRHLAITTAVEIASQQGIPLLGVLDFSGHSPSSVRLLVTYRGPRRGPRRRDRRARRRRARRAGKGGGGAAELRYDDRPLGRDKSNGEGLFRPEDGDPDLHLKSSTRSIVVS